MDLIVLTLLGFYVDFFLLKSAGYHGILVSLGGWCQNSNQVMKKRCFYGTVIRCRNTLRPSTPADSFNEQRPSPTNSSE